MQSASQSAVRVGLTGDIAKRGRGWRDVGTRQLGMVECIEGIHAERQDVPFTHDEVLQSREVEVVHGIGAQQILREGPEVPGTRLIC